MKCEDIKKKIAESNIDAEVWKHVKECKECLSFMDIYAQLEEVRKIEIPSNYEVDIKSLIRKRWFYRIVYAVSAVFLFILGLSSLWIHDKIQVKNMRNKIDKIAIDINEDNTYFIYGEY